MKINQIFILLVGFTIFSCTTKKLNNKYDYIEVFKRGSGSSLYVLKNPKTIEIFEEELNESERTNLLKNPELGYFVNCYYKDSLDTYFFGKKYISKENNMYETNINLLELFERENEK